MPIRNRRALLALGPAVASAVVVTALVVAPGASASPTVTEVPKGNPTCATAAPGTTEFKVEPVVSGTRSDGTLTVQLTVNDKSFDWSADKPVQVVIAKGGPGANIYDYGTGAQSDTGLVAPKGAGLSHVSFCYGGNGPTKPPETTTTTQATTTTTETKPTETTTTTRPPAAGACGGLAYDLRLDVAGILNGFLGPISSTERDQFPDRNTFSDLNLIFPLTGADKPVLTATTLDAENSGNPTDGCTTRVTYENVVVDLNNITPTQGIPVRLTAKVLETVVTAKRDDEGVVQTTSQVTIIGGSISINGQGGSIPDGQVPPNSGYTNEPECFANPSGAGKLCVTIMLHETEMINSDGREGLGANAVRIKVFLETPLPPTSSQLVDLKLAHAEAYYR